MKRILIIGLLASLFVTIPSKALSRQQWQRADVIAEVAAENWSEYGVLPSVAVAQAFVESTLGKHCSGNNLWGIRSGAESYPSLESGVMRYLRVINNGCYPGAPYERSYSTQLRRILDGGYCEPEGSYYDDAIWGIEHYNFDKYDKMIPTYYTLKYSKKCPSNVIQINSKKAGESTVAVIGNSFFDTERKKGNKNTILVSDKKLNGKKVTVNLIENVKG